MTLTAPTTMPLLRCNRCGYDGAARLGHQSQERCPMRQVWIAREQKVYTRCPGLLIYRGEVPATYYQISALNWRGR